MFKTSRAGPGAYSLRWQVRPPITRVIRGTTQLCANRTYVALAGTANDTPVQWDTIIIDDVGAFNKANPTVLTTPALYSRVRFQWGTAWQSNGTGGRWARLTKNGVGVGYEATGASGGSFNNFVRNWQTWWYPTVPGDNWLLGVGQSSGGNLNFGAIAGGVAFFQAEWGF